MNEYTGAKDVLNKDLLQPFPPVSLERLREKGLLKERIDFKYVFHSSLLEQVLLQCQSDYEILEIDGHRSFHYVTIYYDTAGKTSFSDHHRGKGGRYKLRYRHYVESNIQYLEIKWKSNKGKTHKERTAVPEKPEQFRLENYQEFLSQPFGLQADDYAPSLEVRYERISLLHRSHPEKLTIDLGLQFSNAGQQVPFEHIAIAEVKTGRNSTPMFNSIMRSMGIREGGMSKYCMGAIALYPQLKYNLFKQEYLRLQKINQPDGQAIPH